MKKEPPMSGMTIDQFMQHSTRGGGGGKHLKGWKKEGTITVWLSCQASINTRWTHGFYRCEPREDKETKEKTIEVWQDKLGCRETEEDLGKRYFRDKKTGEREYPPALCPDCKMSEDIYQRCLVGLATAEAMLRRDPKVEVAAIEAELRKRGEIWWLSPLFQFNGVVRDFEGRPIADRLIMHAGGMFHAANEAVPAFANKKLTAEHKALMARVPKEMGGPLYFKNNNEPHKEVWRQNFQPKMEYVFVVANNAHPEGGLQIAVETSLLGDKMKTEIGKEMKRAGATPEKGNPLLYPYAFRWDYDGTDGIEFSKKYDATALTNVRLMPAVEKLIRDTEPPNEALAKLMEKPNLQTHRARLEKYAVGGGKLLPFDQYFADAVRAAKDAPDPAAAAERPAPEVGRPRESTPAHPAPAPPPEDEEVDCDATLPSGQKCGAVMKMSDPVCPSCGFVYDVQPAAPPPPPPRPTRSQAKAARAAAPAPAPAAPAARGDLGAAAPPVDDLASGGGYPGDDMDDLPFACAFDVAEDRVLRRFRRAVNF